MPNPDSQTLKPRNAVPESARRRPRSQEERRSATIAKLTDAAIEALVALGYAKASTNEICQRAGVSQGALFRHFPTRGDFMTHVADEVRSRLVGDFESRYFSDERLPDDPIERGVRFTREICHSQMAKAWFELVMASRTDETLQDKMSVVLYESRQWIREAALKVFPDMVQDRERFHALVDAVVMIFDMESIYAHLDRDEAAAERRLEFAIGCYRQFFIDQEARRSIDTR
ncbi:TetR/AcrR family transcriptional regulator [Halomonas campisalis]|uniref:TetR/AcrR family transcriptional regulator n=1 Tax=Billgrantia campisalis TaxID=74661 RepID=A0ABS9P5F4_9GAMM|nr:TetR/AcrR family transcriptional regulator [Halomonas campisalis]MCG6656993.1 TetR/AcrR family transcriptional regulator [Halomonas campisalis]MDR5862180.1 TetR/AcrR family transcriptional regulator [Halomonas campisalis]